MDAPSFRFFLAKGWDSAALFEGRTNKGVRFASRSRLDRLFFRRESLRRIGFVPRIIVK